jgi:DNA invertase Pin-like site-specific DNA recombinase
MIFLSEYRESAILNRMTHQEAVIYCRISKDRTGAGVKVADQETSCRKLAAGLGKPVRRVYSDNDISAAQRKKKRLDYEQMITDLEAAPADVICMHADRLHRRPAELERYIDLVEPAQIMTYTVMASDLDLGDPGGRMMARMLGAVASHEVEHMGRRQQEAKKHAAAKGIPLGGRRPFGYSADGMTLCRDEVIMLPAEAQRRGLGPVREVITRAGTRVAVVLPYDEAAELEQAVIRLLAGASLHFVARDWNARGVLTASGYRWSGTEVRRVACRARNSGELEHNAKVPGGGKVTTTGPAAWPAVITRRDRLVLRALLHDPARMAPGAERRHLGSGIYLCCCGATMVATTSTRPAGQLTYRCAAVRRASAAADPGAAHAARDAVALDDCVATRAVAWLAGPGNIARLTAVQPGEESAGAEIGRIDAKLDEFAEQAAREEITGRQLAIASRLLIARRKALAARQPASRHPDVTAGSALTGRALWQSMDLDRRRALVSRIFEVRVLPQPNGRPAGWRAGQSYFHEDCVEITRKL